MNDRKHLLQSKLPSGHLHLVVWPGLQLAGVQVSAKPVCVSVLLNILSLHYCPLQFDDLNKSAVKPSQRTGWVNRHLKIWVHPQLANPSFRQSEKASIKRSFREFPRENTRRETQVRTFRRVSWRRKSPKPAVRQSTSAQLWGTPPRELGLPDPPRLRCVAAKTSRSKTRLREQPCSEVFLSPDGCEKLVSCPKENIGKTCWTPLAPLGDL